MKVIAIVPLRYKSSFDSEGMPRLLLNGRPLWDITLEQAFAAGAIDGIAIAHDDDRWLDHLGRWRHCLEVVRRPPALSQSGITTLDVLAFAVRDLVERGQQIDRAMLLEVTHPLRPQGVLEQIAVESRRSTADSLITCYPVRYSFWRQDDGLPACRLAGPGDNGEVRMYQELIGIGSIFSPRFLATTNPFGDNVDVIPIDRFWATIDVRDEDGVWLAEQYLRKVGRTS